MTESTRQMLNKSIDLLHKLSKKKVTTTAVKNELSDYLSNHISLWNQINSNSPRRLEEFTVLAEEIIDDVDAGKIPLYEGIMLLNRMVMPEETPMVANEFDPTGNKIEQSTMNICMPKEEPKKEVAELIEIVLKNKELLDKSVVTLNTRLKQIGYELKPVNMS